MKYICYYYGVFVIYTKVLRTGGVSLYTHYFERLLPGRRKLRAQNYSHVLPMHMCTEQEGETRGLSAQPGVI
jgi:hypothetical protein